ncbi:MAG: multidrug efflux MFS transporter, partial [Planctomycetes bacterium]|nr:multidrug efflux MFS transporter [Planctomycetota bacterium]
MATSIGRLTAGGGGGPWARPRRAGRVRAPRGGCPHVVHRHRSRRCAGPRRPRRAGAARARGRPGGRRRAVAARRPLGAALRAGRVAVARDPERQARSHTPAVDPDPARRTFQLVWLNNFVTAIGMMGFLPLFPLLLRDLGLRDDAAVKAWSGVLVGAAPLTAAFMGPVWGVVGDRIGRKPMMVRANLAITLFVGLMAFARTPGQLLALRLLQGVFSGFIAPSITLVSVSTPLQRQGHVTGLLATAVVAGSLVGPTLGGLVADHAGFAAVFAGCAALSSLAAALVAWGV